MRYFITVEHGRTGEARALLGSELAFKDFYGERHPALIEIDFEGPDAFKGGPPPDRCLFVFPRETIPEEFATPFIRLEG